MQCLIWAPLFLICPVLDKRALWVFFFLLNQGKGFGYKGAKEALPLEGYLSVLGGEIRGELLQVLLERHPDTHTHTCTHEHTRTCMHTHMLAHMFMLTSILSGNKDAECWRQTRRASRSGPSLTTSLSFHLEKSMAAQGHLSWETDLKYKSFHQKSLPSQLHSSLRDHGFQCKT